MTFDMTVGYNSTEAEAIAEIEARGWHALTLTAPPEDGDWHWHDFDSLIFVLEGQARVEFMDGSPALEGSAGARISAPREVVHREITGGYRAVFGLSVDPMTLTEVNKPLPVSV
jgi:quercetin dioxygenase-like cupin family protein